MKLKHFFGIAAILMSIQTVYAQRPVLDGGDIERVIRTASPGLVGSWVFEVETTATPAFRALQTFHAIGTMSETSDLLPNLGEGPGHGAWQKDSDKYNVTFELFIFEPDHTPAGRIRVRETLELVDENHLTGFSVADLILPDGTLIENIDNGPMTGTRVRVIPVRPEEQSAFPVNAGFARRHATTH